VIEHRLMEVGGGDRHRRRERRGHRSRHHADAGGDFEPVNLRSASSSTVIMASQRIQHLTPGWPVS